MERLYHCCQMIIRGGCWKGDEILTLAGLRAQRISAWDFEFNDNAMIIDSIFRKEKTMFHFGQTQSHTPSKRNISFCQGNFPPNSNVEIINMNVVTIVKYRN